jgi:hypothetical protein
MIPALVTALTPAIANLLSEIIPDPDERDRRAHEIALTTATQAFAIQKAQLEVNKQEAAHKSIFVAGWRPFIGWVCGVALAFNVLVVPIGNAALKLTDDPHDNVAVQIEPLDSSLLWPVMAGMLGLGGLRTREKEKGVAREK